MTPPTPADDAALAIETTRQLLIETLERGADAEKIAKIWGGPRHNDIGVTLRDGRHFVLKLRDFI